MSRNPQDVEALSSSPHLWHTNDVMGLLKALTDRSGIREMLTADGGQVRPRSSAPPARVSMMNIFCPYHLSPPALW